MVRSANIPGWIALYVFCQVAVNVAVYYLYLWKQVQCKTLVLVVVVVCFVWFLCVFFFFFMNGMVFPSPPFLIINDVYSVFMSCRAVEQICRLWYWTCQVRLLCLILSDYSVVRLLLFYNPYILLMPVDLCSWSACRNLSFKIRLGFCFSLIEMFFKIARGTVNVRNFCSQQSENHTRKLFAHLPCFVHILR